MGSKVAQFYGYSVCLVTIIAFLVSVGSLAGVLLEWGDPLHAGDLGGVSASKSCLVRDIQDGHLESPVWRPTIEPPALHAR